MTRTLWTIALASLTGFLLLGCPQGGVVAGDDDDDTGDDDATGDDDDDATGDDDDSAGDDDDATGDDDDDTTPTGPVAYAGPVDIVVDAWGYPSQGQGEIDAILDTGELDGTGSVAFNTMGDVVQVDVVLDATVAGGQVVGTLTVPLSAVAHWFDDVVMSVEGTAQDDLISAQISYADPTGVTASGNIVLTAQ